VLCRSDCARLIAFARLAVLDKVHAQAALDLLTQEEALRRRGGFGFSPARITQ